MANLDRPIIVTGCARSGTSLVAGVIHYCGAWIGKCTGPTPYNKRGQFENEFIRDKLTKPFLAGLGVDPMGQDPLPDVRDLPDFSPSWRDATVGAIKGQGYSGDERWMFKGAKACLIWPVWHGAFPEADWVVVRREDTKIVDSCMRTPFMRKRRTRASWQEWVDHHKRCFSDMVQSDLRVWFIWPGDSFLPGGGFDLSRFHDMITALGLKWNEGAVRSFLDPELWRG